MAIATIPRRLVERRPPLPVLFVVSVGMLAMLLIAHGAAGAEVVVGLPPAAARPLATASVLPRSLDVAPAAAGLGFEAAVPPVPALAAAVEAPAAIPVLASASRAAERELREAPPASVPLAAPAAGIVQPQAPVETVNAATLAAVPPQPAVAPPPTAPVVIVAPPSASVASPPGPAFSGREQRLFEAMNAQRLAAGLPALATNGTLTQAARMRSQDMSNLGYFAHVGPTGQSWYSALAAVGWTMSGGGENLAKVSGDEATSVAVAVDRLMASPTHRANIVSQSFRLVGVGAVVDSSGTTIFTTIFTDR